MRLLSDPAEITTLSMEPHASNLQNWFTGWKWGAGLGLAWAGLSWAGLGWAGLGWAEIVAPICTLDRYYQLASPLVRMYDYNETRVSASK